MDSEHEMNSIICNRCGRAIVGSGFSHHIIGNVTVIFNPKVGELCYYCAANMAYEAALQWKTETDQSNYNGRSFGSITYPEAK